MNETTSSSRDSRDPELEALVGRTIAGKYSVLRLIGRGGMGAVYEAENVGIGKKVALKFVDRELARDEQVTSRFAREARAASSIESNNIVTVFDAGIEDGRPYLVMELLRGEDLGTRLRRLGRVPVADALHIAAQVLRGLSRAHDAGIIHRDLKPDNVFLVKGDGDPLHTKIVDFGVSKIHKAQSGTAVLALTGKGTILGTPLYMAPEQAQAVEDLDGRADLFSLGAILFECLAGRPPHTGESYEQIILSICMTDAPALEALEPSVPAPVCAFVAKALARNRNARFRSAPEMLRALHEVAPDEKLKVPLEPMTAATLVSNVNPHAPTLVMSPTPVPAPAAGPPTDVSWSSASKSIRAPTPTPTPSMAPSVATRLAVPLTAFGATLAGVIVTSWIVTTMRKDAPVKAPPAITQAQTASTASGPPPLPSSGIAPPASDAPPVASAPPADPPVASVPSRTPPPPGTPRAGAPKPRGAPTATATSAPAATSPAGRKSPLDISRELPE
jgi:eukaryotic-like serine/threonine-protein kinase